MLNLDANAKIITDELFGYHRFLKLPSVMILVPVSQFQVYLEIN